MKTIYSSGIFAILLSVLSTNCFSQAGILDTTFGDKGISIPSFGGFSANSVLIQPDSRIIVGSITLNSDFALARLKPNGRLDSSFGINGGAIIQVGAGSDWDGNTALQKDKKVLFCGLCRDSTAKWCFALVRFDTAGVLDGAFGDNGQVITSFNNRGFADYGYAVAVQQNGKIIEVGSAIPNAGVVGEGFAAVRFNSDGSIDKTFGTNGEVITTIGNAFPSAQSVIVQPDGKIILGGYSMAANGASCFALLRYDSTGTLDNTFGNGGKVTSYFGNGGPTDDDEAYAMALQPDGKILLTGLSDSSNGHRSIPIVRYNANGTLDNTFGTGGKVNTFLSYQVNIYSITLQEDKKIIVVGNGSSGNGVLMLVRYSTNGLLDTTFGLNGVVLTSVDSSGNQARAVTMQQDGRIVIAGLSVSQGAVVARYISGLNTGILDFSAKENPILIYPNPIQTDATLQYTLPQDEKLNLVLYDMQGRLVQIFFTNQTRAPGEHNEKVCFNSNLTPGNYILSISNDTGVQGIKIVKQ